MCPPSDLPDLEEAENYLFSLDLSDMHPIYTSTTSELYQPLSLLQRSLKLSSNPNTDNLAREALTPTSTGVQTCNGAYFVNLPQRAPTNSPKLSSQVEFQRKFVLKPAAQEAGVSGNPSGLLNKVKEGIEGGQGVIRERLAYTSQKYLGIDFGVPPTGILSTDHTVLSKEFGIIIHSSQVVIRYLEEQIEEKIELNVYSLLLEADHPLSSGELAEIVTERILELDRTGLLAIVAKAAELISPNGEEIKASKLLQMFRKEGGNMSEFRAYKMIFLCFAELVAVKSKPVESGICSAQQFVPGCVSLAEMLPEEKNEIPVTEVHKLLLDLILYNTDRNNGNVLYETNSQKIILIDHGMCLPDARIGLDDEALMEWVHLEQANLPLTVEFAEAIKTLDIDQFVSYLKDDMEAHSQVYGDQCVIDESAFYLLELNVRMVKVGIAQGASLKEMALMQHPIRMNGQFVGGDLLRIYNDYIHPYLEESKPSNLDWLKIEKELKLTLINIKMNLMRV